MTTQPEQKRQWTARLQREVLASLFRFCQDQYDLHGRGNHTAPGERDHICTELEETALCVVQRSGSPARQRQLLHDWKRSVSRLRRYGRDKLTWIDRCDKKAFPIMAR